MRRTAPSRRPVRSGTPAAPSRPGVRRRAADLVCRVASMRIASVSDAKVPNVATVLLAKLLQGYAATFVRSEGEHFVVSVNGQERTISIAARRHGRSASPINLSRAGASRKRRRSHRIVSSDVSKLPIGGDLEQFADCRLVGRDSPDFGQAAQLLPGREREDRQGSAQVRPLGWHRSCSCDAVRIVPTSRRRR
jgi:hypothetical protein